MQLVADRLRDVGEVTRDIRGVIKNLGASAATNVVVRMRYDPALFPIKRQESLPGEGFLELPDGFQWTLPRIEPGQTRVFGLECECRQASPGAQIQFFVDADGGLSEAREQAIEISPTTARRHRSHHPRDTARRPGPARCSFLFRAA